ncbi:MAG: polymerase IV protein [Candidatus Uhrbacteria bacterium GW2011_GWE2_40_58]|nr:MAG: polymerase IV protein [Candidatus Uhrbacteria bacterium GW2011_GWF2_40_263]KKR68261.1 MAG: polymerase IV protein [Candidatus Uhrbacteria bacterium GW2011_GWE2_40_58]OGL92062.1 MAG: hypothetical protein A2239_03560 [Candidatus Uhrbacteria bacterium RIFOXYA2_FULL_40_9]
MHVDMNSYFASVEQQANPFLRGRPIGVTGKAQVAETGKASRGIVVAASIEAKQQGIKTAMSTWEAKHLCPSLLFVQGDPEKYAEITHRFNVLFHEFTDFVEMFSVDESFLDVTEEAKDFFGAIIMAQMIKQRLKEECGERITCSIGIGVNKLMAKLASDHMKPDGLVVVKPSEECAFLDQCVLSDVCGIGYHRKEQLQNLGIFTFKRLREYPLDRLIQEFKSVGYWLHEAAYGRGDNQVIPYESEPKSIGHSYTLSKDTTDKEVMKHTLLGLADKVAWRLRRDGYQAKLVRVYIRFGDFSGFGKEKRFEQPLTDGLALFKNAWPLIKHLTHNPVRLLGISVGALMKGPEQPSLFKKERKVSSVLCALDHLQTRYGSNSWTRASLLGVHFQARSSGFHFDQE